MNGLVFYHRNQLQHPALSVLQAAIQVNGEHRITTQFNEFLVDVYVLADSLTSRVIAIDFDNTIYDIPMESIPIKAGTVVGTSSVYMYYGVAHTAVAAINVGVGLLAFTAIGVVGAGAMY